MGFALAVLYFWLAQPTWHSLGFGLVGIVPGLLLRAVASGHVRKNEELTTSGPYAYTRNPLYVGSMLIGAGFAIAARSWWIALAMIMMFLAIYLPVIQSEEDFLVHRFPDFEDYAGNVPRFIPRIRRAPSCSETSVQFSLDLYRQHREYNALIGTVAVIAGLVAKMTMLRGS